MLIDATQQKKLEENGYVHFPFLNKNEVEMLKVLYKKYEPYHQFKEKFHHSTFHIGNNAIAQEVDAALQSILLAPIHRFFEDFTLFVGNFMIKETDAASEVVPHQDWTYVDETKYGSLNLWIPLQDVNQKNGCLTFLPKSHQLKPTLRTSPYFPSLFDNVMHLAKKNMVGVPMKCGEAVLFYRSTLHGSYPNISGKKRVNVVQGIYNKNAQLHHYFMEQKDKNIIYDFEITKEDFYHLQDLQKPTTLHSSRVLEYEFPTLSEQEFYQFYPKQSQKNIFKNIKAWWHG